MYSKDLESLALEDDRSLRLPAYASTGIPGLDALTGGGIPRGRPVMVVGGTGAGKTTLMTQFLMEGLMNDESCCFVSLDESRDHYFAEMRLFGWNLDQYTPDNRLVFLDLTPARLLTGEKREISMKAVVTSLESGVKSADASRVALDGLSIFLAIFREEYERRNALIDIVNLLTRLGVTSMMSTEMKTVGLERVPQFEEFLAHGVIILQTLPLKTGLVRVIQVPKMRGTKADPEPRPYRITPTGIEVFQNEKLMW